MSTAGTLLIERGVRVRMSDGCELVADVWRETTGGPAPAVLLRTPYGRADVLGAMYFSGLSPLDAVAAGFVVVLQDVRGRFDSDGTFRAFVHEADDGHDTAEWIRAQPWSNGSVSTFGASYFGLTALSAAQRGGVEAVAALFTSADPRDGWLYTGGAFELALGLTWSADALGRPELERRASRGLLSEPVDLDGLLSGIDAAYAALPLRASPVGAVVPEYGDWLDHPRPDDYWRARSTLERVRSYPARVLHVAGWFDIFLAAGLRDYRTFRDCAATPAARRGQRLIIGPWAHAVPHDGVGECYFGPHAGLAARGVPARILEFFVAPPEDGAPRVSAFVMGENRWREFDDWPPPQAVQIELFLHSVGRANTAGGDGRLQFAQPDADVAADTFVYDPRDPVPTAGGAVFLPGVHANVAPGPRSQHVVEARADVLVYTGEPLTEDLVCVGPVSLALWAASSAPDTDWTARLVDVAPNGRTLGVCDGIVRCRYRTGADGPRWLEPDRPEQFVVELGATGWRFAAGHRIRLQVSSSNFPRFDRNPNSRIAPADATADDLRDATQTVFHDGGRPSRLILSVLVEDEPTH